MKDCHVHVLFEISYYCQRSAHATNNCNNSSYEKSLLFGRFSIDNIFVMKNLDFMSNHTTER